MLLAVRAWGVLDTSLALNSHANTPWGTPLWIPQTLWFAGLAFLVVTSVVVLVAACAALSAGRSPARARDCRHVRHPGRGRGRNAGGGAPTRAEHRRWQGGPLNGWQRRRPDAVAIRPRHPDRGVARVACPGLAVDVLDLATRSGARRSRVGHGKRVSPVRGSALHSDGRDPAAQRCRHAHVRRHDKVAVVAAGRAHALEYRRLRHVCGDLRVERRHCSDDWHGRPAAAAPAQVQ